VFALCNVDTNQEWARLRFVSRSSHEIHTSVLQHCLPLLQALGVDTSKSQLTLSLSASKLDCRGAGERERLIEREPDRETDLDFDLDIVYMSRVM
jgi:hypothetical protein